METLEAIQTFIGTTGFPIACTVYLIHYMQNEQAQMRETIAELKNAITKLTERIGHDREAGNS